MPSIKFPNLKNLPKIEDAIAIELTIVITLATLFLPGGEDLHVFYRPFAEGCLTCAFNPWHASWILFPLRLIPSLVIWPVWTLLTLLGIVWASRRLKTNVAFVLLAFPTIGLIWLGQVDVLLIVGLALALTTKNPYWRGVGLLLASVKPQVTGIAILVLLWQDEERLKALIIPALVLIASAVVWGVDWPIRWLASRRAIEMPVWGLATLFPYALVAFGGLFLVKDKQQRVAVALLASALAVPWFGIYSYAVFLVFFAPWWAVPLSYLWAVGYPWYGNTALRFAWILPLGLLIGLLWPSIAEKWAALRPRVDRLLAREGASTETHD
jgi:hypothetical protein